MFGGNALRAIGAAVVCDQYFTANAVRAHGFNGLINADGKRGALVQTGHENGEFQVIVGGRTEGSRRFTHAKSSLSNVGLA